MGFNKRNQEFNNLKTKIVGNTLIIYIYGMLDMTESFQLEKDLMATISKYETHDILLNMQAVSSISSSGIRVFIALLRLLKTESRQLKLSNASPQVLEIFTFVGLRALFKFYSTEEEALAAL